MIIIPDKLRRPAEVERDELRKQLAEAQAEIENLKWHINNEKAKAEAALTLNDRALGLVNEARAEIELKNEELDMFLAEQQAMGEIIESKDRLIERMKNCQNCGKTVGFCRHCRYAPDKRGWDDNWKEPV